MIKNELKDNVGKDKLAYQKNGEKYTIHEIIKQ